VADGPSAKSELSVAPGENPPCANPVFSLAADHPPRPNSNVHRSTSSYTSSSFADAWSELTAGTGLPPVGKRLSDDQRAAVQRVMADPALGKRTISLYLADPRHKAERHGWPILLADADQWIAKAKDGGGLELRPGLRT
jgi:hypothetical protein